MRGIAFGVAALAVTAITVAGCGRKGPLERPPQAEAPASEQRAADATVRGPDKPFILDRLLR